VNQDVYDRAEELAPRHPNHPGQLRSDVLRFEILYRFGGCWVDADFECLRPIDGLLDGVSAFAAWEEPDRWVAGGIMGATAGHPFIAALIDGLAANVEANRGRKPNMLSGPRYVTRVWQAFKADVTVFPKRLFYPYLWSEIGRYGPGDDWPDAWAVHHWSNRRRGG
jgi:mannosyltransferase OCH1-like enzyme